MDNLSDNLDISIFSPDVKRQLVDFYQFLVEKYVQKKQEKELSDSSGLPDEFYKPIKVKKYLKFDREEIYQDV
ncbi:MAG: hypothetical protein GTO45_15285 [Candidatus Aminicenantes bacterium]|nr:hypothetical protein [Candidatus Aminicenantes bacterium]NIM80132.1 hypothetical protein [Candidatus Aminicenantes bacterium]NIN19470.1 hypothetical protein [Candidatus Aminicenantes bacterium]NIN43369.1 hypothetical protein [Candidatus Aminicenantes bacterium]NIN86114.1 hypothetical protein [Candidatus Aminicenantes bacterium]